MANYENLGLLYNRHYHYHPNYVDNKTAANKVIWKYEIKSSDRPAIGGNVAHLFFETTYPGLIVGMGYPHETHKNQKEAIITGFFFDHTSGAPCIPGSSTKGVVRSIVKNQEYFAENIAPKHLQSIVKAYTEEEYAGFVECLFGRDPSKHEAYETDDISIYNRLIFLDSYAVDQNSTNTTNKVFSLDYLAPHKDNQVSSLLSNPDLVKLLKVVPQVVFDFAFIVPSEISYLDHTYTKSDILLVIKNAIEEAGVGAKTNTGYGYLSPIEYQRKSRKRNNNVLQRTMEMLKLQKKEAQNYFESIKDIGTYKNGKKFVGKILEISDGNIYVSYLDDILVKTETSVKIKFEKELTRPRNAEKKFYSLEKEAPIMIRVNSDFNISDKNFSLLPIEKA